MTSTKAISGIGQHHLRNFLILLCDSALAALSFPLAMVLRHGGDLEGLAELLLTGTVLTFLAAMVVFLASRLYRRVWHLASLHELRAILKAGTIVVGLLLLLLFVASRLEAVPRTVPIIQWGVLIAALLGARLAVRQAHERTQKGRGEGQPILVIGAGPATSWFLKHLAAAPELDWRVQGLIGLKPSERDQLLGEHQVIGHVGELDQLLEQLQGEGQAPAKLVVGERLELAAMQRVAAIAKAREIAVFTLPSPAELRTARPGTGFAPRPVALEDFLNRPQIRLDRQPIESLLAGRRVLITGAGGSIGSELARQVAHCRPKELVLIDASEYNLYKIDHDIKSRGLEVEVKSLMADIRDRQRLLRLFDKSRPEVVFHAAALKHVPLVEANPVEGVLTNVFGTRNVADAARMSGAMAFVQVSTDKAVNTTNVMGATKRLAEFYIQSLDLARRAGTTRFMTVRFGNVLGSSGSVVPLFQRQLETGGPLTVTHPDVQRYFMTIPEAVELILHSAAHGVEATSQKGRIFVLDMGKPIRIVDLARRLVRLAGFEPDRDIEIAFTGLRPGEKLHEELFDAQESIHEGPAAGIFSATSAPLAPDTLENAFLNLEKACRLDDEQRIKQVIESTIPGYRPDSPEKPQALPLPAPAQAA